MIWINGKKIASMMINGKMVSTMWRNGVLIWQSIRSCFGSGVWKPEKPWIGTDKWKNNR